jgi:cation-transporting ATPase E
VAERSAAGLTNSSRQSSSRSVRDILRENVFTLFNGILSVCFVVLLVLGDVGDGVFYAVVLANLLVGLVQEVRAKRVLDRLALLNAPTCAVKGDGTVRIIPLAGVVLKDVLVLRPGDQIAADARVLQSNGLVVDESLLTGESEPVSKDASAPLFSGSFVADGTGYAEVTAIGADAYAHRLIAELRQHSLVRSELREATNRILVVLSFVLGPVIVLTVLGRVRAYGGFGSVSADADWRLAVLDSVASVVGMIPEGLVLLISLAFGVAAIQLARSRVLVQELAAVEVLARVDVLCLDKTGTLTSGRLDWDRLVTLDPVLDSAAREALGAFGADDAGNLTAAVIATQFALGTATVTARQPFSSRTKMSGVTLRHGTGPEASWLLGAPEKLLKGHPFELGEATSIASTGQRALALVRAAGRADSASPGRPWMRPPWPTTPLSRGRSRRRTSSVASAPNRSAGWWRCCRRRDARSP